MNYPYLSKQHDVISQTMHFAIGCVLIVHTDTAHSDCFVTRSPEIADRDFWGQPNGLCDMPPFEACVRAYYAWLDPDGNWNVPIIDICLPVAEVAFITNEV